VTLLQKAIKKIIEENCKKGVYAERFSPECQKEIKRWVEKIAILTAEDEEFLEALDFSIEESIRLLLLQRE
jgi:hypothetical protein